MVPKKTSLSRSRNRSRCQGLETRYLFTESQIIREISLTDRRPRIYNPRSLTPDLYLNGALHPNDSRVKLGEGFYESLLVNYARGPRLGYTERFK